MPKLRLYEFELTITEIKDAVDKVGKRYLLAKGYHRYSSIRINGYHYNTIDVFQMIALYGSNQILDETVKRFNEGKRAKKKLVVDVIDADISTQLKNKSVVVYLFVYYYDFKTNRFGTRKLIKKLQKQQELENN